MLQSMGSQSVRHDLEIELNWTETGGRIWHEWCFESRSITQVRKRAQVNYVKQTARQCIFFWLSTLFWNIPGGAVVKNLFANAGDAGLIPVSRRFLGGRKGNPLQYSCLGNPMYRAACWATVYGIAKSWIRSDQISRSVMFNSLGPHESQHARLPCPSPPPGVHWDSHPSS